jgi:hypothetical protein
MPIIPALGKLRQEKLRLKITLGSIAKACLKKQNSQYAILPNTKSSLMLQPSTKYIYETYF